ncbi:MAG: hypothetical protein H6Q17_554 [Bacteroidetes bacterium]|nr:hypothetical protein [Bacteroidota bacterium]
MPLIPIQDARARYTNQFIGGWKETFPVTNFLRSFFENKVSPTKEVSIEVRRGYKKIAVDVMRGQQANRNKSGHSTLKTFVPPYYFEGFNSTDLDLYDNLFGSFGEVTDSALVAAAVQEVTDQYLDLKNKIERSYELLSAQVLQTGKITTTAADSIDYKAKATHIKTLSTKWDATTPKIFSSLKDAFDQLRTDGAAAVEFDVVMGASAAEYLLDSDEYKTKFGLYPTVTSQYNLPRIDATSGAVFHNRIAIGPYIVNLWSYNETYTASDGTDTPFLDPKKVIIIAKSFKGFLSFGAVPRVLTASNQSAAPQYSQVIDSGKYILNNYVDQATAVHYFDIKSAGLPVPLSIDHFSCLTVLG